METSAFSHTMAGASIAGTLVLFGATLAGCGGGGDQDGSTAVVIETDGGIDEADGASPDGASADGSSEESIGPHKATLVKPTKGASYDTTIPVEVEVNADTEPAIIAGLGDGSKVEFLKREGNTYAGEIDVSDKRAGEYTVTVGLNDVEQDHTGIARQVYIDRMAPSVEITSPSNNATVDASGGVTIELNIEEDAGLETVEFRADGETRGEIDGETYQWEPQIGEARTIEVVARDIAGKEGTVERRVIVDNVTRCAGSKTRSVTGRLAVFPPARSQTSVGSEAVDFGLGDPGDGLSKPAKKANCTEATATIDSLPTDEYADWSFEDVNFPDEFGLLVGFADDGGDADHYAPSVTLSLAGSNPVPDPSDLRLWVLPRDYVAQLAQVVGVSADSFVEKSYVVGRVTRGEAPVDDATLIERDWFEEIDEAIFPNADYTGTTSSGRTADHGVFILPPEFDSQKLSVQHDLSGDNPEFFASGYSGTITVIRAPVD